VFKNYAVLLSKPSRIAHIIQAGSLFSASSLLQELVAEVFPGQECPVGMPMILNGKAVVFDFVN
jgi:hypothetical protein